MSKENQSPIEKLEQQMDHFSPHERKDALVKLCGKIKTGQVTLPKPGTYVNLHCHTFFSYNSYGYSPTKFAWLSRKDGLAVAGVVDFDVLDALDEFLEASKILGLKGCAGLETRVYVPEFATRVINSPGEPGISYHMGVGFPSSSLSGKAAEFLISLRQTAQERNHSLIERVNDYLDPVKVNYNKDVVLLTPSGNVTERHICLAYARKAIAVFGKADDKAAKFWTDKLGSDIKPSMIPEGRELLDLIRAKTMKQGGVGYVKPGKGSFPLMSDTNRFIIEAGGMATITWLNGLSDGEQAIEELIQVGMSSGATAINIIPDRNYKPGVKDEKVKKLYEVVETAKKFDLPIVVGTEMNSPGQKFVDDFASAELSPLLPEFLRGAHIVYAHSVLQHSGIGYNSEWAKKNFADRKKRNDFFEKIGAALKGGKEDVLYGLYSGTAPDAILTKLK